MDRYLLLSLSFILLLLQSSIFPFLFGGVHQPDIWLVSVIIVSMIFPLRTAFSLAVIGGFLQDLVISNFFGLHLFPYIIIAYLVAKWGKARYNRYWYISVLAVMFGSMMYIILSGIILAAGGVIVKFWTYPLYMGIPFVLYNTLFSVFFHYVLWSLKVERESRW